MTRVVFRPAAEADLLSIALSIADHSVDRARRVVTRLRQRSDILLRHPEAGRPRPELGDGFRSLSERPYVLIYRLLAGDVEIIAVLHGARDLPAALAARIDKDEP